MHAAVMVGTSGKQDMRELRTISTECKGIVHAGLGPQQYTVSDHNVLFLFTCCLHSGPRGWPEDTESSDQSLMALDLLVWDNEVGDDALRESRILTSIELDSGPKPELHSQVFRMKRDCGYSESC